MPNYRHESHANKSHSPEPIELTVQGVRFRILGHVTEKTKYYVPDLIKVVDPTLLAQRPILRSQLRQALMKVTGRMVVKLPDSVVQWE